MLGKLCENEWQNYDIIQILFSAKQSITIVKYEANTVFSCLTSDKTKSLYSINIRY